MSIEIKNPGLLTTIQDLGRYGFRKYGVIVSGSMDVFAHRVANLLVGNEENEAVLEATIIGPEILINEDTLISICGANLSPKINNEEVPMWRPVYVKSGSILTFGRALFGARSYIAFSGSFDVEETMGSKSTYMRAQIGGYKGRQLKKGDIISLNPVTSKGMNMMNRLKKNAEFGGTLYTNWFVGGKSLPNYSENPVVRVTRGCEFDFFNQESKDAFFKSKFIITPQSDRMGYRLRGHILKLKESLEIISEAVALGTIQVPPDGNPILLLSDGQTTGGYPKIANIITVDIPVVAQLKPGDSIKFRHVSLNEAQRLYILREKNMKHLRKVIKINME